jgi:subtilisin family serine protease
MKLNITQSSNIQRNIKSEKQIMVMLPFSKLTLIQDKANALKQSYGLKMVTIWPLKSIDLYCIVFELENNHNSEKIINDISNEPTVDSVQEMQLFKVLTNNDTINSKSMEHLQKGIKSLGIKAAHKIATGKNVRIAVIDSGIDINHPELRNSIEEVRNFVERPSQSYTSDIHGTAIAGIIAADNTNQQGIIGVSPNVKLLAFKACWQTEEQWGKAYCNSFSLAKAINVAILRKVNILNLSLGGKHDVIIDRLIHQALKDNISVVAASGSNKNKSISFPASIPGVIAVNVSSNINLKFDNTAKHLHAPGSNIITTVPGNSYDFFSGSSLSTAFVSGSVALLLEKKPDLSPSAVFNLLEQSALKNTHSKLNTINSCAALALLIEKNICN